jgi:endo-1,4-beta-xylanase
VSQTTRAQRVRASLGALMAALAMLIAAPVALGHHNGLRDVARRPLIGTAVDMSALANDPAYKTAIEREFNIVTPENVMKWDTIEPQQGVTDFSQGDALVRFARANHQLVRGHTLVWHNQLPAWLTSGTFTPAELRDILRRHIFEKTGHFRGRVYA